MDGEALAAVIRGAQRGDPAAYDVLVDQYAGRLFGFLLRLTGSRHDAEDLMQEVFLRVVRMIGHYDHHGRFEAWLFRIAMNLVRDRGRRASRTPRLVEAPGGSAADDGAAGGPDILDGLRGAEPPADASLVLEENIDALNTALAALPDAEREVIMLRHFSQMSFKEISDMMGTPLGTALARAHRGLARLRSIMNPTPGESGSAPRGEEP